MDKTVVAWLFGASWAVGCYFYAPLIYVVVAYLIANSILNNANVNKMWGITRRHKEDIEEIKNIIEE